MLGLVVGATWGQLIEPRIMAIDGVVEPNLPTWETHIAAGYSPNDLAQEHPVIAVSHADTLETTGDPRIAFAIARKNHVGVMEWQQEGLIPVNAPYTKSYDPVIAFNSVTGDFLVAACVNDPVFSSDRLAWSRYFPARAPFSQGWKHTDAWGNIDKPWIVAGQMDATQQEFYTVCVSSGCAVWFRTTTGGVNPSTGQLDPAQWQSGLVSTQACSYPFVATSPASPNKVFVATTTIGGLGTPIYRFFEGTDGTGPQGEPIIQSFAQLASSTGPVELTARSARLYRDGGVQQTYLPIPHTQSKDIQHLPNIAVDPAHANIVYLVYHDTVNPNPPLVVPPGGDEKVDVFFVRLAKNPTTGFWSATTPVAIPNLDPPGETNDNFHPAITVTPGPSGTSATTRIHVVFYSDRRYPGQVDTRGTSLNPSNLNLDAKFNAYYKYSPDGGANWTADQEIIQLPDEPALDFTLSPAPGFDLNDYIGITARPVQNGYEVWTSFMGSRDLDVNHHPSVIDASRVPWPN